MPTPLLAVAAIVTGLILFAILTGCTPPLKNPPAFIGRYDNACLPEAAAMSEGLQAEGIASRVVIYRTENGQHAICAYIYPTGSNKLWAWDSTWKSNQIAAYLDNPWSIAKAWMNAVGDYQEHLQAAFNP